MSIYHFLNLVSDVGGLLKVLGIITSVLTTLIMRKVIMKKLLVVHEKIEYIMSYEGMAGMFEDIQRLRRLMALHVLDSLSYL